MASVSASGAQYTLRAGPYQAVIADVGATLRSLTHHGTDLVVPFDADEVRPAYRGATLAPWPNRIVDGRYEIDGLPLQLPLTEPERGHALHGLLAWSEFQVLDKGTDHATLQAVIEPQSGYPWRVEVQSTFALTVDGLQQTVRGTNLSNTPAPWGTGPHPYLVAGPGGVDDWTLHLTADRVLTVTEERLVPIGVEPVSRDAQRFDYRDARNLRGIALDHAFTDLHRDADGVAVVRALGPHGGGVAVAFDSRCPWVQVHTADRPGGIADPGHRIGLAVEPMTCPPDAFNSGVDLIRIPPGQTTHASWTISAVAAPGVP